MLIDTHCHIDDARFDGERAHMLARARAAQVSRFVTIGCDIANSRRAQGIAATHPDVYFSAGVHPHEAGKAQTHFIDDLRDLARHARCVAIGECGLDYYYDHSPRDLQLKVFLNQIDLAHECSKPIIIHVRDAWDECIEILKNRRHLQVQAVIHCFTGSLQHAKQFVELGCMLSLSGILTFKEPGELIEVAKQIPLQYFLVETDSPYLAPLPHRGKRNEPAYVRVVAEKLAALREMSVEDVIEQTGHNALRTFAIS